MLDIHKIDRSWFLYLYHRRFTMHSDERLARPARWVCALIDFGVLRSHGAADPPVRPDRSRSDAYEGGAPVQREPAAFVCNRLIPSFAQDARDRRFQPIGHFACATLVGYA